MRIAWLSSKNLGGNLSSITQTKLANGLASRGHNVSFYSPGTILNSEFNHYPIPRSDMRGFQARSVVKNLHKHLEDINSADVVLIDWTLFSIASKIKPRVILIDRSPPADRGFLSKVQWHFWKKSWKKATVGATVSDAHTNFVVKKTKFNSRKIKSIPAGVDLELFQSNVKSDKIKLAYHGKVDVNRGVMALPMILAGLQSNGIDASLHIHGKGDAIKRLKNITLDGLEVSESVSQQEIASLLSGYDVGFLPMPENDVWSLASPLKRSEYLASGMVICGIYHGGHYIEDSGEWLQLFNQETFIKDSVKWITSLQRSRLTSLQQQSREYAEKNLCWSHSVDALESMILS